MPNRPADYLEPPRVLLVLADQWPRALLRAALREIGYDASGTLTLEGALYQSRPDPKRGSIRLILLDQDALTDQELPRLRDLQEQAPAATLVLLAPRTRPVRQGPWAAVIRRPASIDEIVGAIERLEPLRPEDRHPVEDWANP